MGTSVPWLKCLEYFGGRNSWPGFEHVNQHSLALEDITKEYKGNIQMDLFARLCRPSFKMYQGPLFEPHFLLSASRGLLLSR